MPVTGLGGKKGVKRMASNDWSAEQYLKYRDERTQPSMDLISRISGITPEKAADIGCGPGNSTAVLAKRFPNAEVTGMDYSEDMLLKAGQDYPDLKFIRCDAEKDLGKYEESFDIVLSNACIQWLPNHQKLIPEMFAMLRSGGILAVQQPMNYDEPIQRIIRETAKTFDLPLRKLDILSREGYYDVLSELTDDFDIWQITYMHRLKGHRDIIEWYRGTGMRPYLSLLNAEGKAEFEAAVLREAKKSYEIRADGTIMFPFPRLFFTAKKS